MDKAKRVVSEFLHNDGKHKTTVDQNVRDSVTNEHIRPEKHEHVTAAVDREVHQEHHQTRIQPVKDKEILPRPEQHSHNVLPVEEKTVHHGKQDEVRQTLERDAAQYKDTSTTHSTRHTTTTNPTMTGERVHHHVHEHIQPVIEKETIQPHVVHTTAPVHETHHAAPVHHETTTLPTKTMDEFTRGVGGSGLGAKGTTNILREYEGCPQPAQETSGSHRLIHGEKAAGGVGAGGVGAGGVGAGGVGARSERYGENLTDNTLGSKSRSAGYGENLPASTGQGAYETRETRRDDQFMDAGASRTTAQGTSGLNRTNPNTGGAFQENLSSKHNSSLGNTTPPKKGQPSMMDKLNPRRDADGDGKAGIFD
ncbi:unnamed protein product [Clonostachys rosea]|uniref:Allergen n=1 Tax=Bionectria ochroleuca TaxID=29856 RepID=A0ABY6U4A2_BIOOC|nr:unnamed protein product [Clonostachys rosea]